MNIKISLKKISFLPLLFLVFPSLYINIGLLVPAYMFISIAIILIVSLTKFEILNKILNNLYKKTAFKWYVYFLIWLIICLFYNLLIGNLSILSLFSSLFLVVFSYYIVYIIAPSIYIYKFFNIKTLYKFLIILLFFISIISLIFYITDYFNLAFFRAIQDFLSNRQALLGQAKVFDYKRLKGLFFEPGMYAYFFDLNLLFILNYSSSKYHLFKNAMLHKLTKIGIFPICFLSILLTLSPIGIFFALLIIIFYALKFNNLSKNIIKLIIIVIPIIFILMFNIQNGIAQSKIFSRVTTTLSSIKNPNIFAVVEPSLYTRIVSYYCEFKLFLHNPIGVGVDQAKYQIQNEFENSNLPLSSENSLLLIKSFSTKKMLFNRCILFDTLAETGFIGFILLYIYWFLSLKQLKSCKENTHYLTKEFYFGIYSILFSMLILSFYEVSLLSSPYHYFIFILSNLIYLKESQKLRRKTCTQKYQ